MPWQKLLALLAALTGSAPAAAQAQDASPPPKVQKKFFLQRDQIKPLVADRSGAIATDRITVDGRKVGFMYREAPDRPEDSGWRFFAGDEDDAYIDDPANIGVYAVNTIANYDPEIIQFLDAPAGSAFLRVNGKLVPDPQGAPPPRD